METVTIKADGDPYLAFLPFPTENCNLCQGRTREGNEPTCVKHCMANVIQYGSVDKLVEKMNKPRMVLYSIK
jgi:anaerobic dimethyl sulfoxide reductase subunit B (iron-sulfur subunit)